MTFIAVAGGIAFPIGLFAPFVSSGDVLHSYGPVLLIGGWGLYAVLTIMGFMYRHRVIFWTLCCLLALNIAGCQLPQTKGIVPTFPVYYG